MTSQERNGRNGLHQAQAARRRAEAELRAAKALRPEVKDVVTTVIRFRTENHLVELILDAFKKGPTTSE
jgi:hypothetical protein